MKQTILVTRGAGFLGSHLCDRFLAEGFAVIAMDNLITGSTDNIAHLSGHADFRFIHHDVTEFIFLGEELYAVVHFASPASPLDYQELPIQTLKVGSLGTHKALGLAKNKGARFLLASTSEVYGDPLIHPQPETYWGNVNPVGPRGVYDEAKRFAEALTMAYQRVHGVDTRIARIFNTFGPRMRLNDGRAIPAFFTQGLRGEPITVFGDGNQTRSFCYVADLVDGIFRLLRSDQREPVNLGNPEEWTVLRMWPKRSGTSPDRQRPSCIRTCPSTTPRCASRTSASPGASWAGRRAPRSSTAWRKRSRTSAGASSRPSFGR
jgi:dTDP-glucose 4,6-dehydratase